MLPDDVLDIITKCSGIYLVSFLPILDDLWHVCLRNGQSHVINNRLLKKDLIALLY
jgi:hypothetical protein